MKKLIKMPSIGQFRNVIKHISHVARFDGLDENEEPVYNHNPLPILKAKGTVKLHGTNGSVCYNAIDGMWVQSKNNIITPEKDNAGFAFFVENNKSIFVELFENISYHYTVDCRIKTISIYGEWAGQGIQKGVGISEINKGFYIFGIKISSNNKGDLDWTDSSYWLSNLRAIDNLPQKNIYNINEFQTFELEIDFNNPLLSQNKMVEMVQEVEKECPVAKHFGVSGIGEGIVFEVEYKNNIYRWKMKGDKHAGKSKVKVAKKVDDKKLQLILDTVEKITPEWRLLQVYNETFDTINGGKADIKGTGDYLRALINDIIKEDSDIISDANLIPKTINSYVSKKARVWFMKKLDEESGLK